MPRSQFRLACALDEDVQVERRCERRGQEVENLGKKSWGRNVDLVIEHVMEENFEGVREVRQVSILVREVKGGRGIILRELMSKHIR